MDVEFGPFSQMHKIQLIYMITCKKDQGESANSHAWRQQQNKIRKKITVTMP
jgi:hypothetical protein